MADEVWVSFAFQDERFWAGPVGLWGDPEKAEEIVEIGNRNLRGEVIPARDFPKRIRWRDDKTIAKGLPPLFLAGDYFGVNAAAAAVLRAHDLGSGSLYPVTGFQADETNKIPGDFFLLNFGNVKPGGFAPEHSNMRPHPFRDNFWRPRAISKGRDVAVAQAVTKGPEIWVDDRLQNLFFVSGPLAKSLKKAGFLSAFRLEKCKVI